MNANPYRGIPRSTPTGWGMYSSEGVLLVYHEEEETVRRWAKSKPGVEVENIAERKARLKEEEKT